MDDRETQSPMALTSVDKLLTSITSSKCKERLLIDCEFVVSDVLGAFDNLYEDAEK